MLQRVAVCCSVLIRIDASPFVPIHAFFHKSRYADIYAHVCLHVTDMNIHVTHMCIHVTEIDIYVTHISIHVTDMNMYVTHISILGGLCK